MFALAAPLMLLSVAAAIDYSNAATYKQELQAAADSAALVATTVMVNGGSIADAEATATKYFASNAPNNIASQGVFNVYSGEMNSTASTTVSFQTTKIPMIVGGILGQSTMSAMVTATSQASIGGGASKITYSGWGSIWGDPHLTGANGTTQIFSGCATAKPTWYNALSDSGIEVNISCVYDPFWGEEGIQDFSTIIGSHVISMSGHLPKVTSNPDGSVSMKYDNEAFSGGVTIDGAYYPPVKGVQTYLGGMVTVNVDDPNNPGDTNNYVYINYTKGVIKYELMMSYEVWQLGDLGITATNAGLCGVPGGIWGQTLAGVDDLTPRDFQVASATSTTPQFDWSVCAAQAAIQSTSHLTQ